MTTSAPADPTLLEPGAEDAELLQRAEARALALLTDSMAGASHRERASSRRMARLLAGEGGRDLLLDLTDRVMRIRDPR